MNSDSRVVIIGGGIQGLSLAYYLALRGSDVVLLEMDTLGSGSSAKSAAMIGYGFPSEKGLPLTEWSFSAFRRFEDELGSDPDFDPIGCLMIADERSSEFLERRYGILQTMGVPCCLKNVSQIDSITPGLNLEGIKVGLFLPQDCVIDPHCIMMAYANQARRRGVRIMEGVKATGLEIRSERVHAVHTTAGTIETQWVVNAAGAFANEVASWIGLDLPITPCKRHILVTGPLAAYQKNIPFTYQIDPVWYIRREGPGLLMGMGSIEVQCDDVRVEESFLHQMIDYGIYRAPALEQARLMTSWAGLRPLTPDEDPILGMVPQVGGFINDCGWGGQGVMNAPAAGMALSELIVDGEAVTLDIRPFSIERFF